MDVDSVFRVIGELGRQQLVYVAYLLMLNTYAAFHMIQVLCNNACFVTFVIFFLLTLSYVYSFMLSFTSLCTLCTVLVCAS